MFDPTSGEALFIPKEKRLFLPLVHDGAILGVFLATGVRLKAARAVPPLLREAATLCLENLLLYKAAISDPVTGLFNEAWFNRSLEREIDQVQGFILPSSSRFLDSAPSGGSGQCGLILADIDYFKTVFDRFGLATAERILNQVADALEDTCPEQASACRLSDDLFAILCPGYSPQRTAKLAEKVRKAISRVTMEHGDMEEISITASVGSTTYPADLRGAQLRTPAPDQARSLFRKARLAIGVAKELGRNQVMAFNQVLPKGGTVLEVLPLRRLSVSLGKGVDAMEGQRFLVWSPRFQGEAEARPGGSRLHGRYPAMYKAEVMLTDVQEDMAFAEVLSVNDSTWEIEAGDRLALIEETDWFQGGEVGAPQKDIATGLYSYRDFLTSWSEARQSCEKFSLVLLRLSGENGKGSCDLHSHDETCVREIAVMAQRNFGEATLGGRYSLNTLCFFIPNEKPQHVLESTTEFFNRLGERYGMTPAAGIAGFPFLTYSQADALENCRKALDHALLLPAPMAAMFDSISLNISADRLFTKGDVYGAIEEFKLALLADNTNMLAKTSLGACYAKLGRFDQAAGILREVSEASPADLNAAYNLGCTLLRLDDFSGAATAFEHCLSIDPKHLYSLVRLGLIAEKTGEPEDARACFLGAARLEGGEAQAARHLARLDLASGNVEMAREYLHTAITYNPTDDQSIHSLAKLYLDSGKDPEIAASLASQSAELKPDNKQYLLTLWRALKTAGRPTEAEKIKTRADEL